jgi:hypothetical protein
MNHLAVLSAKVRAVRGTGPGGPCAGADPPLHAFGRSASGAGLSAMAHKVFFAKNPRTRPGRDHIEGESSKALFGLAGRPMRL